MHWKISCALVFLILGLGCISGEDPVKAPPPPKQNAPIPSISSFEECAKAGYPVLESHPRQCKTLDGRTFVEVLEEPVAPPPEKEKKTAVFELDVVYKTDNTPKPIWVPPEEKGSPWMGAIYLAKSEDGLSFSDEKLFVHRAGVPNLLLTKDKLIATFQYFSFVHQEMFDVIAYTVSEDFGETWAPVKKVNIQNPCMIPRHKCNDPSLVELEDGSLRLYMAHNAGLSGGLLSPDLYSVKAASMEGPWEDEGPQLNAAGMIDPAVVYFKGKWHHYTVKADSGNGRIYENIHTVSEDGYDFVRQSDIILEFGFLGAAVEDNGRLRFYGTGNGVESATSLDGYTWTVDSGKRVDGADPGIAKLPDETYLMVYTRALYWKALKQRGLSDSIAISNFALGLQQNNFIVLKNHAEDQAFRDKIRYLLRGKIRHRDDLLVKQLLFFVQFRDLCT